MSQMKDTDDKAIQAAGRRLRETYVPMLASIGPRNVASLLVREAVMVSDDAGRRRCAEHSRWSKPTFTKCHRATELNCARPLEPRVACNERPADFQSSSRGQPRWLLQHRSSRRRHRRILCRAL